jgi:hypothetical protein
MSCPADCVSGSFAKDGKGLFVQCRDGPQNPQAFKAEIGTMFEVLGLVGVEYEFEGQFFKDSGIGPDSHVRGQLTSSPLRPMHYTDLQAGAPCWITITDADARYETGTYRGTITKVPAATYPNLSLHCLTNSGAIIDTRLGGSPDPGFAEPPTTRHPETRLKRPGGLRRHKLVCDIININHNEISTQIAILASRFTIFMLSRNSRNS